MNIMWITSDKNVSVSNNIRLNNTDVFSPNLTQQINDEVDLAIRQKWGMKNAQLIEL